MKLVVAAVRPTPILWRRASALESPTEIPASTLPARGIAPVRANIASRSVVLPLWNGPTSALHRGPRGLLTSCPIAASLFWSSALDWVGGSDARPTSGFWQAGNRRCSALFRTYPRRAVSHRHRGPMGGATAASHEEGPRPNPFRKERVDCLAASAPRVELRRTSRSSR